MDHQSKVLLTGVTGFLGSHTTIQLLEKGYQVIGTLRNLKRSEAIRKVIGAHTSRIANLTLVEADLSDESIWMEITKGVGFVQHIASPFPRTLPKDENDLIIPAKNGTLNVLKAAARNGVKRLVLTSSTGAVAYGKSKEELQRVMDENDWTDISNKKDSTPYFRSKTIAEKAAWDFVQANDNEIELTTVCPGAILGPVLENDFGTSANIVIKALDGSMPAVPNIGFEIVDVRSVSDLLIKAMESPHSANQRFIASAGYMNFMDIAQVLKASYPKRKIPSASLPNFAVRLFSNFDRSLKPILLDLGIERKLKVTKAIDVLDWQPIAKEEALLACAKSVLDLGIVK